MRKNKWNKDFQIKVNIIMNKEDFFKIKMPVKMGNKKMLTSKKKKKIDIWIKINIFEKILYIYIYK